MTTTRQRLGIPDDALRFDRVKGDLLDTVTDPAALPYRQALESLQDDLKAAPTGFQTEYPA